MLTISLVQNTLSPNPAGINFPGMRQVHVSTALGGVMGGGVRNQVLMSPRGQLILTQTIPSAAAATLNMGSELKNTQSAGKGVVGPVFGVNISSSAVSQSCLTCLLYTSPSPRDRTTSRMPSSA